MIATMRWAALALAVGLSTMADSARAEEAEAATMVTYQQVHALTGNEGRIPGAANLVRGPDGKLYGTAESGGQFLGGTVFRMTATGAAWAISSGGNTHGTVAFDAKDSIRLKGVDHITTYEGAPVTNYTLSSQAGLNW